MCKPRRQRQPPIILPFRQVSGADEMKDQHVQPGDADENHLGDEKAVAQIFGGVGYEHQTAGEDGHDKRPPSEWQNGACDAADRPFGRSEPEKSQIDDKNGTHHQTDGQDMH